ncbi:MAG: GTP-binding protein [Thermoplasmata archaeon]|nr:MAG: GTP-binding protein [Thermoplasmata archaeon]
MVLKKIVLLGDSAVGKTSMIRRFVFDKFEDSYISTIGTKVSKKSLTIPKGDLEVDLNLMIWDVLGRAGYTALHSRTFSGVHGAFLVADLTRRETLDSLERYWIPVLFNVVNNVPLVFACNKKDLEGEYAFQPEEMEKIASKYNVGVENDLPLNLKTTYSTSAKTGDNVENIFQSLGYMVLSEKKPKDPIAELYENLVAQGIYRHTDRGTLIGATDAIIVDFCEGFEDDRLAMTLLRQELLRAGLDVRSPSKVGLLKAIEYLAEAESEFKEEEIVMTNKERRREWARGTKG